MDDSEVLGTLIRTSRLDKGLSRDQLGSAIGRSSSSVRRWENGESAPAESLVAELAGALDLDEDELRRLVGSAHGSSNTSPEPAPGDDDTPKTETTIEDDDVIVEVMPHANASVAGSMTPRQQQAGRFSRMSSAVFGSRDAWIGWVRGFLTALALLFLFMGLVWALGELLVAMREVLDSFSTGASGG